MSNSKKKCFVVQGFGEKIDFRTGRKLDLDASYEVIKEAVENAGLECVRADEIQHSQIIDKPMYESILNADLVIADLSTSNVNAAYELGVRHALCRRTTIIVAEKEWDFPFDINRNAIRTYEHLGSDIGRKEAKRFSEVLTKSILEILEDEDAVDSPLYTFIPQLTPPTLTESDRPKTAETVSQVDEGMSVKAFTDQARAAIKENDFQKAKFMYEAAHKINPFDESIIQRLSFAIYKSKQPSEVEALWEAHDLILDKLDPERANDPETIGLWAAIHKRLWSHNQDLKHLETSIDSLERGFNLQNDYYNGINLAFMLNERAASTDTKPAESIADYVQAMRVRLKVISICQNALNTDIESDEKKYWILATLWEAFVGVGDRDNGEHWEKVATLHVESKKLPGWMVDSTKEQIAKLEKLIEPSPLERISR